MTLTDIIRLMGQGIRLARSVTALTGGTSGVEAVNITNGGTGYSNSFAVSFSGGGGSGAAGTATAINGVIQRVVITNQGSGYTSAPTPNFSAGSGTGGAGTVLLAAQTLDAIKTVGVATGLIVFFPVSKVIHYYQLRAGTDAESAPKIIRPDDYATTTNEKVWELQGIEANNLVMPAGALLSIASGTGQRAGNAVLVAGTVTVTNSTVTANTVVLLSRKTAGGVLGNLTYTLSAGSSFTINSDNALDTSTVSYLLIEVP